MYGAKLYLKHKPIEAKNCLDNLFEEEDSLKYLRKVLKEIVRERDIMEAERW